MEGEREAAGPVANMLAPDERLLWSGAPSAGGLFLASLPSLLGALLFGALAGTAFAYAILTRTETGFAASGTFLAAALFAFARNLRSAFGAHHLHYAITPDRILSLDDRGAEPLIVRRSEPEDRMRDTWLDGEARRGWRRGGLATVKIPCRAFQLGTGKIADGYQRSWLRFVAVERADEAVALLNGGRAA